MPVTHEDFTRDLASPLGTLTRPSLRPLGLWVASVGWASMAMMWITGSAGLFGHDQEGVSGMVSVGLFLAGWTVMVAAMMLPSSLPTLRRVDQLWESEGTGIAAAPRFMIGYFFAWGALGAAAFVGDGILHLSVESMPWLAERPSLIIGGVAMFAGAAEILARPPAPVPSVLSGAAPLAVGKAHAVDRIRRCWPLMLFAMAVGMRSPVWMVGLTLVMAIELRPRASAVLRLVGLIVFGIGAMVILHPAWMPVLFGEGRGA